MREGDPALRAFDPKVTPEEKPSFQPWAADKIKQQQQANVLSYSPASFNKLPKEQKLAGFDQEIAKLSRTCMPAGVPRIGLGGGHGMELVQHPGVLVQLIDANHDFRVIPTDGRAHSKDPAPAFNGEEVGHWDESTLVSIRSESTSVCGTMISGRSIVNRSMSSSGLPDLLSTI